MFREVIYYFLLPKGQSKIYMHNTHLSGSSNSHIPIVSARQDLTEGVASQAL